MNKPDNQLEKMQEMLPDYVFGRLSATDKTWFDKSLPQFPSIKKEVDDARSVFETADLMEYDSLLTQASQNISVKVNERLATKKKSIFPSFSPALSRFAMPLAAVVAVGFWGYETDFCGALDNNISDNALISDADFDTLFDEDSGDRFMDNIVALEHSIFPNELEHLIHHSKENEANEILDSWVFDNEVSTDPIMDQMFEYEIESIIDDEDQFQKIYGES